MNQRNPERIGVRADHGRENPPPSPAARRRVGAS